MMKRAISALAVAAACVIAPVAGASGSVQATGPGIVGTGSAHAAVHLRAGEFCSRHKQRFYRRHGFVCRRARDGRNRLFRS
jgi:hypothetical protein